MQTDGVADERHPVRDVALVVGLAVAVLVRADERLVRALRVDLERSHGGAAPLGRVAAHEVRAPDDRAVLVVEARVLGGEVQVYVAAATLVAGRLRRTGGGDGEGNLEGAVLLALDGVCDGRRERGGVDGVVVLLVGLRDLLCEGVVRPLGDGALVEADRKVVAHAHPGGDRLLVEPREGFAVLRERDGAGGVRVRRVNGLLKVGVLACELRAKERVAVEGDLGAEARDVLLELRFYDACVQRRADGLLRDLERGRLLVKGAPGVLGRRRVLVVRLDGGIDQGVELLFVVGNGLGHREVPGVREVERPRGGVGLGLRVAGVVGGAYVQVDVIGADGEGEALAGDGRLPGCGFRRDLLRELLLRHVGHVRAVYGGAGHEVRTVVACTRDLTRDQGRCDAEREEGDCLPAALGWLGGRAGCGLCLARVLCGRGLGQGDSSRVWVW